MPVSLGLALYFVLAVDHFSARSLTYSLIVSTVLFLTTYEFGANRLQPRQTSLILAFVCALTGVVFLSRGLYLFVYPEVQMFTPTWQNAVLFFLAPLLEIGFVVGFIMLNSQRLEQELVESQQQLKDNVASLERAIGEVKTLSGLLPICAHCRKIRDDQGYWQRIELYISSRTEAEFTHCLCPPCAKELYPELQLEKTSARDPNPKPPQAPAA
ncbi:MAG TPA: hypothetical protein PKO06_04890 [Candidatus Ozemobacteraceae bacterium]|nr:hypothetical protein [Candidatus Ozemobacteraceae bacterium]